MHSQNPWWRYARSSPAAAMRSQRLALEHAVGLQIVEHAGPHAEEAAVDPVLGGRLLAKARHAPIAIELGDAELQQRAHNRHRRGRGVGGVKLQESVQVDVGDSVGVGRAEALPREAGLQQLDPPSGRGVRAGVLTIDPDAVGPLVDGDELLDQLAAIASRQHEPAEALPRVELDHVPHDRVPPDLHERLRDLPRVLLQPCPPPTAEDHDLGPIRQRARAPRRGRRSWRAPRRRRRSPRAPRSAA